MNDLDRARVETCAWADCNRPRAGVFCEHHEAEQAEVEWLRKRAKTIASQMAAKAPDIPIEVVSGMARGLATAQLRCMRRQRRVEVVLRSIVGYGALFVLGCCGVIACKWIGVLP